VGIEVNRGGGGRRRGGRTCATSEIKIEGASVTMQRRASASVARRGGRRRGGEERRESLVSPVRWRRRGGRSGEWVQGVAGGEEGAGVNGSGRDGEEKGIFL
jgi:hypothetical protein